MAHETLLIVALLLVAGAVLMQALAMWGIRTVISKIPEQIETIRTDINRTLDPIQRALTDILTDSREPVRNLTTDLAEVSRVLRNRSGQVDSVVEELVDRTRLQIVRVDQLVSDLCAKVENTSDVVERNVLVPIQELSAVMKGLRAGLEFLFSRRRPSAVAEATQDEQMFI